MIFKPTAIAGVLRLELERNGDERGFFARTFCREEFQAHGIRFEPVQCSTSYNARRGTLRGLHYQAAPHAEAKIVRCTRGRVFDVVVDLRPDSPSFRKNVTEVLTPDNGIMLFIPRGIAHGFLTLEDASEAYYMMSESYNPGSARGVRWNDPAFGIAWPSSPAVISDRDRNWPDFSHGL